MNYYKIYYDYINYVKLQNRSSNDNVRYEKHHIYPKSIFPKLTKDKDNIVLLTPREHYLAHLTLVKVYDKGINHQKMCFALFLMAKTHRKFVSSKEFERLRYEEAKLQHETQKGKTFSEEHKLHLSQHSAWKGTNGPNAGKKFSDDVKKKISNSKKGCAAWNKGLHANIDYSVNITEESRYKMGSQRGKAMTDEVKDKISKSHMGIKHTEETKKYISKLRPYYSLVTGEKKYFLPNEELENFVTFEEFKKSPLYKKKSYKTKGLHWYTNGIKNVQSKVCPKGFVEGKTCQK